LDLVSRIAKLTGADVAASTDPTGAAERGGNWDLEYTTGPIEAAPLAAAYEGLLANSFTHAVDSTREDTQVELTFEELFARWIPEDSAGIVDAFVVESVSSGTLLIGISAGTATPFESNTNDPNDTVDAANRAYWTPDHHVSGDDISAFKVSAADDGDVRVNVTETTGSILREYWLEVPDSEDDLADLVDMNRPDGADHLAQFDIATDDPAVPDPIGIRTGADNYGQRIRGYLVPPETGTYSFHVEGAGEVQLWLSQDMSPDFKRKIVDTTAGGEVDSDPIKLREDQNYYIEVLQKAGTGTDKLVVSWSAPGMEKVTIPSSALMPIRPEVRIFAEHTIIYEGGIVTTHPTRGDIPAPASRITFERSDDFGRDLTIYYTFGGTAEEDDFTVSGTSGSAKILAGESSTDVEISAEANPDESEGETVVIRLTPSDDYALVTESSQTATVTIYNQLPENSGLLPEDPILNPSARDGFCKWDEGSVGTSAEFRTTTTTEDDPPLPFTNVMTVTINAAPDQPANIRPKWAIPVELEEGDLLHANFWLRNIIPEEEEGSRSEERFKFAAVFEEEQSNSDDVSIKDLYGGGDVGSKWTEFSFWFKLKASHFSDRTFFSINLGFKENVDRTCEENVGSTSEEYAGSTIAIGGLSLLNYGKAKPADPGNYGGRQSDAAWRDTVQQNINSSRMGDLTVVVQDGSGEPVEGAQVQVNMQEHEFGFGAAVDRDELIKDTAPTQEVMDPDAARYRKYLRLLFNKTVLSGALKWPEWAMWDQSWNRGAELVKWISEEGIDQRGHTLIWGKWDGGGDGRSNGETPNADPSIKDQYLEILNQNPLNPDRLAADTWLLSQLLTHIGDEAGHEEIGEEISQDVPRILEWDVVNHPLIARDFWGPNDFWRHVAVSSDQATLGNERMIDMFLAAREEVHAQTALYINEGGILATRRGRPDGFLAERYASLVEFLLETYESSEPQTEVPLLDGIGFMSHFDSGQLTAIDEINDRLSDFAPLGKTLQSTEFDVGDLVIDQQTQADFTRDFLNVMFGRPETNAVVMWSFWQGREAGTTTEGKHLFNRDWTVKPNGQAWLDLVHQEWSTDVVGTTWNDGNYTTRAFYGDYEITVEIDGQSYAVTRSFTADTQDLIVTVADDNEAPTDITLSANTLAENQPVCTVVGTLTTSDPDGTDTHTYSLVSGTGDADNAFFSIDGSTLKTAAILDYETKSSYNIRVETDDGHGGTYDEVFTVTVTDVSGTWTIGPSAWKASGLTLIRDGNVLHIYETGATDDVVTPWGIEDATDIAITARNSEDDALTVAFSGGDPVPSGGVSYEGGAGGNDSLVLTGGALTDTTYTFSNENDGSVSVDGSVITYTGLEPISSTITATNVTLNYSSASETIIISDSGVAGQTSVDSTVGETVAFNNPTGSLTINAGGGDDTINITSIAASYSAHVNINGQTGSDTLNINGEVSLDSKVLTVTVDTINVGEPVTTGGGDVVLSARGDITLNDAVTTGGGAFTGHADSDGDGSGTFTVAPSVMVAWVQRGLDIDGESAGDESGDSVALSGDGNTLVVGAYLNDGNGNNVGQARVYAWNGSGWAQRGLDIDGEATDDQSGHAVALSGDGNTLVVGARYNDGNGSLAGHARVYTWNGSAWVPRGLDIDGEAAHDWSGYSVSLSGDGNTLVVGAPRNDSNGNNAGHARVYAWNGSAWVQRGSDIDGEAANDNSGHSVSLSGDGNTLVVGAPNNDGHGSDAGHARVYAWDGSAWVQRGPDIDGEATADNSGRSVALSGDGNTLVVGAPNNDGNGSDAGHVRVYAWSRSPTVSTSGGNVSITAADVEFTGAIHAAAGVVSFLPSTATRTFDLGATGGAGQIALTDAELDFVTTSKIVVGDSTTGDVTFTSTVDLANADALEVVTGGDITEKVAGNAMSGDTLIIKGDLAPGLAGTGSFDMDGSVTFDSTASYEVNLNGTADYDQLVVAGDSRTITLSNTDLVVTLSIVPAAGSREVYRIIESTGTGSMVIGTFQYGSTTLNHGDEFTVGGTELTISYLPTGDVALTESGNTAPKVSTNTGVTVDEASSGSVIGQAKLETTDTEQTATELTYTLDTVSSNGTLRLSGTPLSATDTFTQLQINAGNLTYDHNGSETTVDSFQFDVSDGIAFVDDVTFNISITGQNDAPTATNMTQTQTYAEGTVSVVLDDIVGSDADTGETITATLTLNNPATGALTATSGNGETYTSATGIWTITGIVANANAALAVVAFEPMADNDLDTTVTTHVEDAEGTGPADGAITLDVTAINDAPVITTNTLSITEGGTVVLSIANIDTADPDNTSAQITHTASAVTGGQFELVASLGAAITSFTQEQVNSGAVQFVHDGVEAAPSYTLTANDGSIDSTPSTVMIGTFTNINDAPIDIHLSNNSVDEHMSVGTVVGTLSTTDPDLSDTHTYSIVGDLFTQTFLYRNGGARLSPGDEQILARYDTVTLQRSHYFDIDGNTWSALKAINPDIEIYVYQNASHSNDYSDDLFIELIGTLGRWDVSRGHSMGRLRGDNEELILTDRDPTDPEAQYIEMKYYSNNYILDVGSHDYQAYWIEATLNDLVYGYKYTYDSATKEILWEEGVFDERSWKPDGVFGDVASVTRPISTALPYLYPTDESWSVAMNEFINAATPALHDENLKLSVNRAAPLRGSIEELSELVDWVYDQWVELDNSPNPQFSVPDAVFEEGAP
ncbi:MAG: endo-1,4-beta-xylanase, partial [Phycisphaeraceae bacterium]|nr:endo-1,4-beta-xylanase [Phycisphaeraceae bacterium]